MILPTCYFSPPSSQTLRGPLPLSTPAHFLPQELPHHLARGEVTRYTLTVQNETRSISAAELKPMEGILGAVTEIRSRCCFYPLPLSLYNVTAVHLTAINSKGATEPTYLALPSPGQDPGWLPLQRSSSVAFTGTTARLTRNAMMFVPSVCSLRSTVQSVHGGTWEETQGVLEFPPGGRR